MSTTALRGYAPATHPNPAATHEAPHDSILHDIIGQLEQMLLARHGSPLNEASPTLRTDGAAQTHAPKAREA